MSYLGVSAILDNLTSVLLTLSANLCTINLCDTEHVGMMLNIRIRKARLIAGLTQAELATILDVGRTAVANWERAGNTRPCTFRLEKIALVTQVSHEWLATGRGKMTYQQDLDQIPAIDADMVDDPVERRLLHAFRASPSRIRRQVIEIIEPFLTRKGVPKFS